MIGNKNAHNSDRSVLVLFFLSLYSAFVIMFGLKLQTWDENIPGQCYSANQISTPTSLHPLGDDVYLAITSIYFFTSMTACGLVAVNTNPQLQRYLAIEYLVSDRNSNPITIFDFFSGTISGVAHLFNADKLSLKDLGRFITQQLQRYFALVPHDERPKLIVLALAMLQYPLHIYMIFALRAGNEHRLNGDSENYWGFGQIVALVLLASSVLQGLRAILGRLPCVTMFSILSLSAFTNTNLIDYRKTLKEKWLSSLPTRRASI